ncbi:MAG: DNA/RNA nuclease SfsA [Clostridiales Family XIII bacterium]|jgi:sugar fermentation stimulation protein A|nr:DNA/RNA nuclease SfsA [Clostridiales Family XIII bacterium]
MTYPDVSAAKFISRPNRFIAYVELDGALAVAHVKNTGRCRELLLPGATVYLSKSGNPERKTLYDLVAVQKGERLVNMDSQAPNAAFGEYLRAGRHIDGASLIKAEAGRGRSRFDFYVEAEGRGIFIEVKGVTLEEDGVALFPDAPTERGVKHLRELADCVRSGYEAHVVFVIQMRGVKYFSPNDATHAAFGAALREAVAAGVAASALDCRVRTDGMDIRGGVEIRL